MGEGQQDKRSGSLLKIPNPCPGHVVVQRSLPVSETQDAQRAGLSLPGFCGSSWRPPSLVPWRREVVKHVLGGTGWFFSMCFWHMAHRRAAGTLFPMPFVPKSSGRDKACQSCHPTPLGLWLPALLALKQSQWGEMNWPVGCENRQVSVVPSPFPKIIPQRGNNIMAKSLHPSLLSGGTSLPLHKAPRTRAPCWAG